MRWDLIFQHWDAFMMGVWYTLHLTFLAVMIGFFIALPGALAQARKTAAGYPVGAYVYFFRGTPLIVQTYLIYYGLGQFEWVRESWFWVKPDFVIDTWMEAVWPTLSSAWWCALIAFSLNSGAYQTEILRGAIATTPKGEIEGAKALGLTKRQQLWLVILPSAMRRAMPQYTNEIVFMLHGTAIASVITIQDILGVGRWLNAKYYVSYEGLITAALLYMAITFTLIAIFRWCEHKFLAHLKVRSGKKTKTGAGAAAGGGALVAQR